jgi:DNA ligase (NAD+)
MCECPQINKSGKNMRDKKLETQYLRWKYEYYILGAPTIPDSVFDENENKLRQQNNPVIELVDFPTIKEIEELGLDPEDIVDNCEKDDNYYPHLTPMLSLEKTQVNDEQNLPLHELENFLKRTSAEEFECTMKYDGNGIELIYRQGKLNQALTRGRKTEGKDKTDKISHLVPTEIEMEKYTYQIRGELVIEEQIWHQKYNRPEPGKVSNPRNYVAGVLGRDYYSLEELNDLVFIAYDMEYFNEKTGEHYPVRNTMTTLKELGFNQKYEPLVLKMKNVSDFEEIYKQMKTYRAQSPYWIDGIVLKYPETLRHKLGETNHHPKWAMAVKFPPSLVQTTINEITWTMGKDGEFTPVALVEPTILDGTVVRRASLHNLGYIVNNGCFPGAKVTIAKKGEIIPQIIDILEKSPYLEDYLQQFKNIKSKLNYAPNR